jgi:septal ring factor EnvC (AmiA/AmiB activator)
MHKESAITINNKRSPSLSTYIKLWFLENYCGNAYLLSLCLRPCKQFLATLAVCEDANRGWKTLKKRITEINDKIRSAKNDSKEIAQDLNDLSEKLKDLKQVIENKSLVKN